MSPQQLTVAEQIILLHKTKHGTIHWQNHIDYEGEHCLLPQNISDRNKFDWLRLIKAQLVEMDLIQPLNDEETRLTLKGEKFVSFAEYYKKVRKKEREERIERWPKKYWYIIEPVSFVLGVLVTFLIMKPKEVIIQNRQSSTQLQNQPLTKSDHPDSLHPDLNNVSYDSLLKTK